MRTTIFGSPSEKTEKAGAQLCPCFFSSGDFVTDKPVPFGYTAIIKQKEVLVMRLKDKVAIVTGGSRGIGYATAEAFLREGAVVILTASSPANAEHAVSQLKEKYPDATVAGISPDLSSLESVREAFRSASQTYGCVDILVNNAGVSESTPFTDYTEEAFDKVMDLNVKGVFNATKAASECMIARGKGVILSTSSMVSIYGQPSGIAYPASKFAVNGLTVSLARELGPKGIRVNAVAPGITETDMMKAVPKEVIEPMIAQIPLRRLGQPEDIANAFVFLASDEASYITGVVLSVDGMART
jgi:3-oxoacyl-[acyl-carrier protein] reductase